MIKDAIESKLEQGLSPVFLEVANESHGHNVNPGAETHFKVVVVSHAFSQKNAVARHRSIYGLLSEELDGGVHALALHTYTPDEWADVEGSPDSPACLGGSKK